MFLTEVIRIWLEQPNKLEKTNKKFNIFHLIVIVRNHCFIILKLSSVIKGFILYQIKQTTLKSGYNFTTYGKFMDISWIEELKTPLLYSSL